MKDERNKIDELFREGLGGLNQAPPPDVWERIDVNLPSVHPAPEALLIPGRLVKAGATAAIIAGALILWFILGKSNHESGQTESIPVQKQSSGTTSTTSGQKPGLNSDQTGTVAEPFIESTHKNDRTNDIDDEKAAKASDKNHDTRLHSKTALGEIKPLSGAADLTNNNYPDSGAEKQITYQTGLAGLRLDFTNWLITLPAGQIYQENFSSFSAGLRKTRNPLAPKRGTIPLIGGVYASRDIIYYGKGHHKQSRAAGLSLSTFKGPWEFETGVALNISDDNGKFDVNFSSFDSIGYYNKVVSFSPDPQIPGRVIFNTVMEGVYDSVGHKIEAQTVNRYSYLQIPLMAGYRIYADRLFTISLKAGPVFSVLLASDEPPVTFSREGAILQSIDNQTPVRASTNWQIAAALGAGMHISRSLTLQFEPTYRSYLRPVYQHHRSSPYSIGLKAGLLYRF
jgi:hypothetical protein